MKNPMDRPIMHGRKTRPTKPAHCGIVKNSKTFAAAYEAIESAPSALYRTAAATEFTAEARVAKQGRHKGEKVIVFKQSAVEMARAYECCWGHKTNCNRTYIDSYTPVV